MATMMVKVAGEGLVNKAHRNSDAGPTSGSSTIYEVNNIPAGVSDDEVIERIKKTVPNVPANDLYEVDYSKLP